MIMQSGGIPVISPNFALSVPIVPVLGTWRVNIVRERAKQRIKNIGTLIKYFVIGMETSRGMRVRGIERSVFIGNGRDRYMNGSNVTDTLPHVGQTRVDLSDAWNQSTITLSLRFL